MSQLLDPKELDRLTIESAGERFSQALQELESVRAELSRLTALLEDRQQLTHVLREAWREWETMGNKPGVAEFQADRLIAYLKPLG